VLLPGDNVYKAFLNPSPSDRVEQVTGQKSFALSLVNGTISVADGLPDKGELLRFLTLFKAD